MSQKKKKIGILGGGQLARMLALKAHEIGIEPHVLSASPEDPAAQVTSFWTKGDLNSVTDLKKFLKKTNCVTFENEFINTNHLLKAMKHTRTPVLPHPFLIAKLQDRLSQKKLLKKYKIPTADFVSVKSYDDLIKAFHLFNKKLVLKKRRFGYDGYGTFVLKTLSDLKKIKPIFNKDITFIGEAFIPFKKELALSLASHKNSSVASLPLVETFQENFRCLWVKGPVSHKKASSLIQKLKTFVKAIKYEGVIAFELFETKEGLIVNEIAPRVHNSAHYSLNALSKDQFTLHLDACLRQPLQTPKLLSPGFAMLNLLGKKEKNSSWKNQEKVFLHEYGKKEKRTGRKMGHLNALAKTSKQAFDRLKQASKSFS